MSRHETFAFKSSNELLWKAEKLGIKLPFQDNVAPFFEKIKVDSGKLPNRFAVQPMEGFDAELDGSPSELTLRRYKRYAEGGSGLIWFEATSTVTEGRSNPRQLMLKASNLDAYKRLIEKTRRSTYEIFGSEHDIFCVLQLSHSGRYSRPEGKPSPKVAVFNPLLDKKAGNVHILSDEELNRLQDAFVSVALLAEKAGFDGVDIKACHGYLLNELLGARTRKNSHYGENFTNRIRFLTEIVKNIRSETSRICLAVRLNVYDGIPYPYGFGVPEDGSLEVDLAEPKALIGQLIASGCSLFNITAGNPFVSPHVGRPFDRPLRSASLPEEHPLECVARLLKAAAELQKVFPEVPFVGTGYSWLRHFLPNVGAAVLEKKEASFIGLGRSSFAYPNAPKEIMDKGVMDPKKVCITCSRCSELMRAGHVSGCAVHDKEIYGKEYREVLGIITD